MMKAIIPCALLAALVACTGCPQRADTGYVCTEHGIHHYENRDEQCACLKINQAEYEEYHIFTMTGETNQAGGVPGLLDKLRDEMEEKIVSMVMHRIERAMKREIIRHWQFEQMEIPVTIRGFKKQEGGVHHVMIAAAMTKYSLSPRGIIMYLPLEYKMHILEKKKDE